MPTVTRAYSDDAALPRKWSKTWLHTAPTRQPRVNALRHAAVPQEHLVSVGVYTPQIRIIARLWAVKFRAVHLCV